MLRINQRKTREHEREKKAVLGDKYILDRFVLLDKTNSNNVFLLPNNINNNDNLKRGKT
jgi:hypothetical protein